MVDMERKRKPLYIHYTTRKRAIDDMDTNGAPDMWCATTIY